MRRKSSPILLASILLCCTLSFRPTFSRKPLQSTWQDACHHNAESQLSCGNKISLRHATLADLLLIPGVGDKTAQTLIKERAQILATANADGEAAGLESAKGIGPETAKKLMKYLGLK